MRRSSAFVGIALSAALAAGGCASGSPSDHVRGSTTAFDVSTSPSVNPTSLTSSLPTTLPTSTSSATPMASPTATSASTTAVAQSGPVGGSTGGATVPGGIAAWAFGMHYLGYGSHPYPVMPFRSARIFDTGVTWADLQPHSQRYWNKSTLARLDGIMSAFRAHHVQPLLVLGMTPYWARSACRTYGYPKTTCGPKYTGLRSPWANYVRFLAHRYHGTYFETWNEPNLKNGYNDSISKLARLQATAYTVIHNARTGDGLVSPTVAVTSGNPFGWLRTFFHATGGKRFDVFGLHLYPSDPAAKGGYGPEWSIGALQQARSVLRASGLGRKPVWDTEANVGRHQFSPSGGCVPHSRTYPCLSRTFGGGWGGAAMVARMYVLQLSANVKRIMWYAADDRQWGGTWMEQSNYHWLTYAGKAEVNAYNLLVNARPRGCSSVLRSHVRRYTCRFHLANGRNMLVKWTTGGSYYFRTPRGTSRWYNAIGGTRAMGGGHSVKIGSVPQYFVGSFSI